MKFEIDARIQVAMAMTRSDRRPGFGGKDIGHPARADEAKREQRFRRIAGIRRRGLSGTRSKTGDRRRRQFQHDPVIDRAGDERDRTHRRGNSRCGSGAQAFPAAGR
ncbi:MAG: hypothetical protein ABI886_12530 [Betaproteobacteria bacterium]